ncbi:MAG: shikimate dehydrogenase [Bacillota bacterium]|nr:shikimate dehydrogenase [Bacillota bacterium]
MEGLMITGKTKILGIIGDPVEHSKSPLLHNFISVFKNIDMVYVPFRVEKNNLSAAINGLRALNVIGFNVTVPHKNNVIQYLDKVSEEAELMGAVNTVKNVDGVLYGYNTDGEGFLRDFKEETGQSFKGKKVVIIGAGGAARAITVKVVLEGAQNIIILNRTEDKAKALSDYINEKLRNCSCYRGMGNNEVKNEIKECEIIINTTSVGMHPEIDKSPINSDGFFTERHIVYDIIYNPLKTKLLEAAEAKGCKTVNGLGMLFYQGIYAYEKWNDIVFSKDEIELFFKRFKEIVITS